MSTILHSTEFMKNQKAAAALPAPASFDALQAADGQGLFFAIGDDQRLRLCAERDETACGWVQTDMGKSLANRTPKSFAVSQHADTGKITIAVAVRPDGGGADELHVLTDLPNEADAEWMTAETQGWTVVPFDAEGNKATVDIAHLHLARTQASGTPHLVVGLRRDDGTRDIQNYLVDIQATAGDQAWTKFQTAEDYENVVDQHIGKPGRTRYHGLYELHTREDENSLVFTGFDSTFGGAQSVIKLTPPRGATALAALPVNDRGDTDLYVTGEGCIQLFPAADQTSLAEGVCILTNEIVTGVRSLYAYHTAEEVVLWANNARGELFYTSCKTDDVQTPDAWSHPVPIRTQVAQISAFVSETTGSHEVFAHVGDRELVRYSRDPVTTSWRTRSLMVPALNESIEVPTHTTRITVEDDDGVPQTEATIKLTATSPCNVYVNNNYTTLRPNTPLELSSDAFGRIAIVQEADGLRGVCFQVETADGATATVNPMPNIRRRILDTKDLGTIVLTNEKGETRNLLHPSVTEEQKNGVTEGLNQLFTQIDVPDDTPSPGGPRRSAGDTRVLWAMSKEDATPRYHTDMNALGLVVTPAGTLAYQGPQNDIIHSIEIVIGDFFTWLRHAAEEVIHAEITVVEGIAHFVVKIGKQLYHCVLQCLSDLLHAAEYLLQELLILGEKLLEWLGFIFNWKEILIYKNIFAKMLELAKDSAADGLDHMKGSVEEIVAHGEAFLDQLGGLDKSHDVFGKKVNEVKKSASSQTSDSGTSAGDLHQSPVLSWIMDHIVSYLDVIHLDPGQLDELGNQIKELLADTIGTSVDAVVSTFEQIVEDVLDNLGTLSLGEIFRKLLAIISKLILDEVGAMVIGMMDACKLAIDALWLIVTAEVRIPVLSQVYNDYISDRKLTLLDLCCLIGAIPAEIGSKLLGLPRPSDDVLEKMTQAESLKDFTQVLHSAPLSDNACNAAPMGKLEPAAAASLQACAANVDFYCARTKHRANAADWISTIAEFGNILWNFGIFIGDICEYGIEVNPPGKAAKMVNQGVLKITNTIRTVCKGIQTIYSLVISPIVSFFNWERANWWEILLQVAAGIFILALAVGALFQVVPYFLNDTVKQVLTSEPVRAIANVVLSVIGVIGTLVSGVLFIWNIVDIQKHPEAYNREDGSYADGLISEDNAVATCSITRTVLRQIVPIAMLCGPISKRFEAQPEVATAILAAGSITVAVSGLMCTVISGGIGLIDGIVCIQGDTVFSTTGAPLRDIESWL